jgi:hypothetical protein
MIEYATACDIVLKRLENYQDMVSGFYIVHDLVDEVDWGWIIPWDFTEPDKVPQDLRALHGRNFPFLVDRTFGLCMSTTTSGLQLQIRDLLDLRDKKLAEMQQSKHEKVL